MSSVPIQDGDWLYWWAFKPGAQYRDWFRKPVGGGDGALIFDEIAEAEGKDYFRLGALAVSPDGRLLATLVDDDGSERFKLRDPRSRHRQRHRDGNGSRHRPAGLDQRQQGASSSPRSTTIGAAISAQLHRLGDDPAKAQTLYEENGGQRLFGRRRPLDTTAA